MADFESIYSCRLCYSYLQQLQALESHIRDYHGLSMEVYRENFDSTEDKIQVRFTASNEVTICDSSAVSNDLNITSTTRPEENAIDEESDMVIEDGNSEPQPSTEKEKEQHWLLERKSSRLEQDKAANEDKPHSNWCNICGKAFMMQSSLHFHKLSNHGKARFSCRYCQKGFMHEKNKIRHEENHDFEERKVQKPKEPSIFTFDKNNNHVSNQFKDNNNNIAKVKTVIAKQNGVSKLNKKPQKKVHNVKQTKKVEVPKPKLTESLKPKRRVSETVLKLYRKRSQNGPREKRRPFIRCTICEMKFGCAFNLFLHAKYVHNGAYLEKM